MIQNSIIKQLLRQRLILSLIIVAASLLLQPLYAQQAAQSERIEIGREIAYSIKNELLNKWYPQSIDSLYGGFLSTYTFDFKPTGPQDKFIVTQARHIWSTATAAQLYPDKPYYLACAKNGFYFLKQHIWDSVYGGFFNLVSRQGVNKSNPKIPKDAYGNAFAIYALSTYFKASGDTAALNLAKQTFNWLEIHSHDPVYKGYYQHLKRDGSPVIRDASIRFNSETGYKDQNSSIHLLEAFTALYQVWPDALVRERLQEMLLLIRDKLVTPKGYLQLYFTPAWTPVSLRDSSEAFIRRNKNLDHVSFGHDIETAYLMLEASHALGLQQDTATVTVAKRMLDHALRNGWDTSLGGFYDEGYYFKGRDTITIIFDSKNWWAQAEGLNTLLLMADLFPNDTMHYSDQFKKQWSYIQTYIIDHVNGDWYEEGIDKEPQRKVALKGHTWKGTYHNFRALINCEKRLE